MILEYGCRAILRLGGEYTSCCMLEAGHSGPHYDEFQHGEQTVVIAWHPEPFRVAIVAERSRK